MARRATAPLKTGIFVLVFTALVLVSSGGAQAQTTDCIATLIPRTIRLSFSEITNLSLAWQMSESAFNKAKDDYGASAVIYGVPVSGNYNKYREDAKQKAEQPGYSKFEERAYAYATSELDQTNFDIFRECLASQNGWGITLRQRASGFYKLFITNSPGINVQPNLRAKVVRSNNISQLDINSLTRQLAGRNFSRKTKLEFTLRPTDVRNEASLDVDVGDDGQSIILPPLVLPVPVPVPTPPPDPYVGAYYLYGDANKKETVSRSGIDFLFRNEVGDVVQGSIVANNVTVTKWPVTGTFSNGYIFWRPNYTLWSKTAMTTQQVEDAVVGAWAYNGQPTRVVKEGPLMWAINENGARSRLVNAGTPAIPCLGMLRIGVI
jgi:hypothetical protein